MIEFLLTIGNLKRTKRQGWLNNSIKEAESIADHMHRMGIISMAITDTSINKDKLVKMALVHDLAEAIIGDITPDDKVSKEKKFELEYGGIKTFIEQLKGSSFSKDIESLWLEYEQGTTPEAILCKDIDKYEMIMQAFEYEKAGYGPLQSFFDSTRGKFQHPEIIHLVDELYRYRDSSHK
jgi:putative hydrolase of HD superfamily